MLPASLSLSPSPVTANLEESARLALAIGLMGSALRIPSREFLMEEESEGVISRFFTPVFICLGIAIPWSQWSTVAGEPLP